MTKFTSLVPAFLRDRFKSLNRIILLMLIAIVATEIYTVVLNRAYSGSDLQSYTSLWSSLAFLVAFIRLSKFNEDVYQHDAIRLIPASDTKIYLSNLCTTLIGLLYFMVVQFVLRLVVSLITGNSLMGVTGFGTSSNRIAATIVIAFGIVIATIIMAWATISLIHLIMLSIDAFLPIGRQKIIRGILYIVISFAIIRLGAVFFQIYGTLMNGLSLGWGAILALFGVLVLVAALEVVANIFLMKKFVETAQ
ncbi:ABC transporter permease protein [Secundilactobacillus pentosiphilus]|uniref:ABC transporter permease protein n=1 Tax=Secundilactobacillus pentosiphilus TaxID=1714682 RepID=A0A1Z5ISI0_9LACO|nr:hypothetical protein [Secundilactobacillus pentosiphilus]GAX04646.1 ABC transporter permease protein [Secundilactobacillus pentosiphilus]